MAEIKCPDCGREQEDTNKFCKNCRANLENVKPVMEDTIIAEPAENLSSEIETKKNMPKVWT